MILFTFINCDEIPALITSIIIGIGIVFCGVASVQNVYLWQVSCLMPVIRLHANESGVHSVGKDEIQSGLFTGVTPESTA